MPRLRTLILTVALILMIPLHACSPNPESTAIGSTGSGSIGANAQSAEPSEQDNCPVVAHSLTEHRSYSWNYGSFSIDGSAAIVLCESDLSLVTPPAHDELLAALGNAVHEYGFGMLGICLAPNLESGTYEDPKVAASYLDAYQNMIASFNRVLGPGIVQSVDCRFGWTHYDESGEAVSGTH